MLIWLIANGGWLLVGLLLGGYFALYVLAMRQQRTGVRNGRPTLPCDQC